MFGSGRSYSRTRPEGDGQALKKETFNVVAPGCSGSLGILSYTQDELSDPLHV